MSENNPILFNGTNEIIIYHPNNNLDVTKKYNIILTGIKLGVDYSLTSSCYDPNEDGTPCGHCDACILRLRGFSEAKITDPLVY